MRSGSPLSRAITISEAQFELSHQVVAFLISGELRGFAEQELALAKQSAKPVVPILMGQASDLPQPFEQVQAMHLRAEKDCGTCGGSICKSQGFDL
jgi:hypothetical protein